MRAEVGQAAHPGQRRFRKKRGHGAVRANLEGGTERARRLGRQVGPLPDAALEAELHDRARRERQVHLLLWSHTDPVDEGPVAGTGVADDEGTVALRGNRSVLFRDTVGGEMVGGSDIVLEMFQSGELQKKVDAIFAA